MFGIGGGEMIFIVLVAIMLFGSKNIPEVARQLGKGMAQLKNATNELKYEITKNADEHGINKQSLTGGLSEELDKLKKGFDPTEITQVLENPDTPLSSDVNREIDAAKAGIQELEGTVKRQR